MIITAYQAKLIRTDRPGGTTGPGCLYPRTVTPSMRSNGEQVKSRSNSRGTC